MAATSTDSSTHLETVVVLPIDSTHREKNCVQCNKSMSFVSQRAGIRRYLCDEHFAEDYGVDFYRILTQKSSENPYSTLVCRNNLSFEWENSKSSADKHPPPPPQHPA